MYAKPRCRTVASRLDHTAGQRPIEALADVAARCPEDCKCPFAVGDNHEPAPAGFNNAASADSTAPAIRDTAEYAIRARPLCERRVGDLFLER